MPAGKRDPVSKSSKARKCGLSHPVDFSKPIRDSLARKVCRTAEDANRLGGIEENLFGVNPVYQRRVIWARIESRLSRRYFSPLSTVTMTDTNGKCGLSVTLKLTVLSMLTLSCGLSLENSNHVVMEVEIELHISAPRVKLGYKRKPCFLRSAANNLAVIRPPSDDV